MTAKLKNILKDYAKQIGFTISDKFIMLSTHSKETFKKGIGVKTNIGKLFNKKYVVVYKIFTDSFYFIIWKNNKMIYVNYSYIYESTNIECYYPREVSKNKLSGSAHKPLLFNLFHRDYKEIKDNAYNSIKNKHNGS